eukprot:TRINITY_DN9763_c0_g2_i1.p2 TRINITY_DN9763_c0_g2~~TRINITY_DN9763_c0_g2_i1.p2  ORF type:complete len:188 (+),score=31.67 TRINITY_DN9763_c0_g2_i1:145-708(+)
MTMSHHFSGWQERARMEKDAYWRLHDVERRGLLAKCGSGTLGAGVMGSRRIDCGSTFTLGTVQGASALHKTLSMPIVGPPPPCGMRVGEDLGMSECGSVPPTPLMRRPARFHPDFEHRLQFLESTFGGQEPQQRHQRSGGGSRSGAASRYGDESCWSSPPRSRCGTSQRSGGGGRLSASASNAPSVF